MTAQSADKDREQFIAKTFAKHRWNLAEVLLWIAYRDSSAMADRLFNSETAERWLITGAGTVMAEISIGVRRDAAVIEASPGEALEMALVGGAVAATGRQISNGEIRDRTPIANEQWEDFRLVDGAGEQKQSTVAYPKRHVWGVGSPTSGWLDILFDRQNVMHAFPEQTRKQGIKGERDAGRELRARAVAYQQGQANDLPVGVVWNEEAPTRHGISQRGAKRVWAEVAKDFPFLSETKGKAKRRLHG